MRQRKIDSECSLGKCQTQEYNQSQLCAQGYLPQKARPYQLFLTRTQGRILLKAFEYKPFPAIATRKRLAKWDLGLKN
jgi:hypothetical protein